MNIAAREEQKVEEVEFFIQEDADQQVKNAAVKRETDQAFQGVRDKLAELDRKITDFSYKRENAIQQLYEYQHLIEQANSK